MGKHSNIEHEVFIYSSVKDLYEDGKNIRDYKDGDSITQRYNVVNLVFYHETSLGIVKIVLSKNFIIDLYNDIESIESKRFEGTFLNLPF